MRALRVIVEEPSAHRSEEHLFFKSPVRVGRAHLNDLQLEVSYVSQYHSVITFDDQAIDYTDLGSTNGSVINGARAEPFAPITMIEDQPIQLGPLRLSFERSDDRPPGVVDRPSTAVVRPAAGSPVDGTLIDAGALRNLKASHDAVQSLGPDYQSYRSALAQLIERIAATLELVGPQVRPLTLASIREAYPGIVDTPEYRELLRRFDVAVETSEGPTVLAIAEALGLSETDMHDDRDGRRLLAQVADIVEAFATAFIELRRGLEQFGSEVAVKAFSRQTGLHSTRDARDVVSYLVSRQDPGRDPVAELKGAFADIMIHQVALITGITEGVRSLLQRLSPAAIATDLSESPERVGGLPVRRGLWPFSTTALWRRFKRLHAELLEEDRGVSSILFGREFARSYGAARRKHQGGARRDTSHVDSVEPTPTRRSRQV